MGRIRISQMGCKHPLTCTLFLVVLVLPSSFTALADSGSRTNTANGRKPLSTIQQELKAGDSQAAEMYTGEGARLRTSQLRSTNKAIARAMKDLADRGLSPKWDQSLTILQTKPSLTARTAREAIHQVSYPQTWTGCSYELTLITYSNVNSQWE